MMIDLSNANKKAQPEPDPYAGVDRGPHPTPPVTTMIAGMRCHPVVKDPAVIDLNADIRIEGTRDFVIIAQDMLRKIVTGSRTPEWAFDEAVRRWTRAKAGGYHDRVEAGVDSMNANKDLFLSEAKNWAYRNTMRLVARRETGTHPSMDWIEFGNRWVVRNQHGVVIDINQYRNDLTERYPGLILIGD